MKIELPSGFEPQEGVDWLGTCRHASTATDWIILPGGEVDLGFSDGNSNAASRILDDLPIGDHQMGRVRSIRLPPFLAMQEPVQLDMCRRLMGKTFAKPMYGSDADAGPAYLSWDEVVQLSEALEVEVPSEDQWEYLCRGGTETLFFWGDALPANPLADLAPYLDYPNSSMPNGWGFQGLFVGEWCDDGFDGTAQAGRVVKGGGTIFWPWQSDTEWLYCVPAMRLSQADTMDATCSVRFVKQLEY